MSRDVKAILACLLCLVLGFTATRAGSRLEASEGCQGNSSDLHSCTLEESCQGCGEEKSAAGWWPDKGPPYGDR